VLFCVWLVVGVLVVCGGLSLGGAIVCVGGGGGGGVRVCTCVRQFSEKTVLSA